MLYLSGLLNRRVVDESGREIGKLKDLVITARDQFPLVQALVVAGRDGTRIVSAADVLSYTDLRVRGEGRSDGMIDRTASRTRGATYTASPDPDPPHSENAR